MIVTSEAKLSNGTVLKEDQTDRKLYTTRVAESTHWMTNSTYCPHVATGCWAEWSHWKCEEYWLISECPLEPLPASYTSIGQCPIQIFNEAIHFRCKFCTTDGQLVSLHTQCVRDYLWCTSFIQLGNILSIIMHSSRMYTVCLLTYPIVLGGGLSNLSRCRTPGCRLSWMQMSQMQIPWMLTPPPPCRSPWMKSPPHMDRRNDTRLWKYYLAPNFVCGR